ncbi:MAG: A/G-specific adenine glycosylase [Rothia sp. (in: high G+C Gram-positive bacteria)]|nr:A/G-specific adenine glycosylase [Rothia sp. (in: high G+C Gram-positive bacteria)]
MKFLHEHIIDWFTQNARDLPWRATDRTAWAVMVSEFMLQQTPVVRVLPIWEQWMQRWPTPADLASADSAEVVRAWGRLGYPRRALRLHAAAQAIVERRQGHVPSDYEELLALPGVGSYTAAAISVFAFGRRAVVIDTNIRRVHARAVSGKGLPSKSLTAAETRLAEALMPETLEDSVVWNAATMELGALICTARSPQCEVCPVQRECAWVKAGKPEPDYVPKGQSWHGTDRQLRGAMMAVLRDALAPISQDVLLKPHAPDVVIPAETATAVESLKKLEPSQEQVERCFQGLIRDGLAQEHQGMVSL